MNISIIVAMAKNRAIGYQGQLIWHFPEDLEHFKTITMGHSIIMGRRTFESLPKGALPGRRNIVISRTLGSIKDCLVAPTLDAALDACKGEEEVFVIGGESVFRQALPMVSRLYLTLVDCKPEKADTFFPYFDASQWQQQKKEKHDGFSFIEYELKV